MTVIDVGPAKVDLLRIRAGDRNLFIIKFNTDAGPMDLTGTTIEAQARVTPIDPDPPALSAVVTITDAPNGVCEIRWPGDAVRTLLAGQDIWEGVWDLQIIDGVEDPQTIVAGIFSIESDVTR